MTNQWRAFQDFSTGGSLGDWLVHNLGTAHLALQLDKASPTSVECVEGKSDWLWPLRAHLVPVATHRSILPSMPGSLKIIPAAGYRPCGCGPVRITVSRASSPLVDDNGFGRERPISMPR